MNSHELKTCPFCGGKAKLYKNDVRGFITIACTDDVCTAMIAQPCDAEDRLIKMWNTRDYINPDGLPNGMVLDEKIGLLSWLGENYELQKTCRNLGGEEGTNFEHYDFGCSACGLASDICEPNFCPNCGARVVEE